MVAPRNLRVTVTVRLAAMRGRSSAEATSPAAIAGDHSITYHCSRAKLRSCLSLPSRADIPKGAR